KKDDSWLGTFGDLIFIQKPEDMELYSSELGNWFRYIMYFNDGIKLDLTLIPLIELDDYLSNSDGIEEILIDKDNLSNYKIVPSNKKYWFNSLSEREYEDCSNEFWSVSAYVAKGLLRRELLFALDHCNRVLHPELLRKISWNFSIRE